MMNIYLCDWEHHSNTTDWKCNFEHLTWIYYVLNTIRIRTYILGLEALHALRTPHIFFSSHCHPRVTVWFSSDRAAFLPFSSHSQLSPVNFISPESKMRQRKGEDGLFRLSETAWLIIIRLRFPPSSPALYLFLPSRPGRTHTTQHCQLGWRGIEGKGGGNFMDFLFKQRKREGKWEEERRCVSKANLEGGGRKTNQAEASSSVSRRRLVDDNRRLSWGE